MKCPNCNAELPPTAKFCGACGTTLASPPPPEQPWAPPPPPPEQPWAPPPPPPEQSWAPPPPPPPQQPSFSGYNAPGGWGPAPLPAVEKRFKALRLIAILLKILAFLAALICVIAALVTMFAGATAGSSMRNSPFESGAAAGALFTGFLGGVLILVYGAFLFIFLYGYAEVIYLFLGIEENTRLTNEMLRSK
jgi:hypothetical protein